MVSATAKKEIRSDESLPLSRQISRPSHRGPDESPALVRPFLMRLTLGKSPNPWHPCHSWFLFAAPLAPLFRQHRRCKIHQPTGEALGNGHALKTIQTSPNGASQKARKQQSRGPAQKPGSTAAPLFHLVCTSTPFVSPRWDPRRWCGGTVTRAPPWPGESDPLGSGTAENQTPRISVAVGPRTTPADELDRRSQQAPKRMPVTILHICESGAKKVSATETDHQLTKVDRRDAASLGCRGVVCDHST